VTGGWEAIADEIVLIGGGTEGFLKPTGVEVVEGIVGLVDTMSIKSAGWLLQIPMERETKKRRCEWQSL